MKRVLISSLAIVALGLTACPAKQETPTEPAPAQPEAAPVNPAPADPAAMPAPAPVDSAAVALAPASADPAMAAPLVLVLGVPAGDLAAPPAAPAGH
jgi:PBP1b-binding outer membrane lipoprotein LpoB